MSTVYVALTAVLLGLLAGLAARRWLVTTARIESTSMQPAYHPGQRVLIRPLRGVDAVRRGDVLLLESAEVGRLVAKRAIGLPGEEVSIDPDGHVSVGGRPLAEPYVTRPAGPPGTFRVPRESLLVLGDNRTRSSDSRTWRQPYVPAGEVVGRIVTTRNNRLR